MDKTPHHKNLALWFAKTAVSLAFFTDASIIAQMNPNSYWSSFAVSFRFRFTRTIAWHQSWTKLFRFSVILTLKAISQLSCHMYERQSNDPHPQTRTPTVAADAGWIKLWKTRTGQYVEQKNELHRGTYDYHMSYITVNNSHRRTESIASWSKHAALTLLPRRKGVLTCWSFSKRRTSYL
jgi:hypothetical protein